MRRNGRRLQGTCYDIGRHQLEVWRAEAGWAVRVDGLGTDQRYGSEADAWAAGVSAAEFLDRFGTGQTGT
jgi:hypothetical protein